MSPEDKEILDKTYELAESNNRMLKSLYRSNQVNRVMRAVYWLFIVGASFGAYYFIQPYLESVLGVYSSMSGKVGDINNVLESVSDLNGLLR